MTNERNAWLKERKTMLTASDVAAVLGEDDRRTALHVYNDKISPEISSDDTNHMKFGRMIEDAIANMFQELSGIEIENHGDTVITRHPDIPWLGATLDRMTIDGGLPVEIKNTGMLVNKDNWIENLSPTIWTQLQFQMFVTQKKNGYIAALFHPQCEMRWATHELDLDFCYCSLKILDEFWNHNVAKRIPPQPDFRHSKTAREIYKTNPVDDGNTCILGGSELCMVDEIETINGQIKDLNAHKNELQNKLKWRLGESTFGALPDGRFLSYKEQVRKSYTVKESKTRVLRVVKRRV